MNAEREVRRYTQRGMAQGQTTIRDRSGDREIDPGPRVLIPLGVAPMLAIGGGWARWVLFAARLP